MLLQLPDPESAQRWCQQQRAAGRSIGFVPTMGALHEGHLSLVRRSVADNDVTCVSIFVNPLQFDDPADFRSYPRDRERNARLLERVGCDMVFLGSLAGFFPESDTAENIPLQDPGPHAAGLEGDCRPGHLAGVRTIVERLFRTVGPCRAYFGEKDFQQSLVVEDLARNMGFPEVTVCPTSREPSGLARSSRNVLLNDIERQRATCIYRALTRARAAWRAGVRDAERLRAIMREALDAGGVELEYADLRDPLAWQAESPQGNLPRAQALIAVRIGKVRLIDNMRLDAAGSTVGELHVHPPRTVRRTASAKG